jgi:hypothetical protein
MAMKLCNKARSLEDGVNDGRKHCWSVANHLKDSPKYIIRAFVQGFVSVLLLYRRHGSYGLSCPFSNFYVKVIPHPLLSDLVP